MPLRVCPAALVRFCGRDVLGGTHLLGPTKLVPFAREACVIIVATAQERTAAALGFPLAGAERLTELFIS
jgi:hypothetical protein